MDNEKEEKKYYSNYPYALNTWQDIWKYDPTRLLDLGNNFQVGFSMKGLDDSKENINEEARARSNFLKLVEDERRPISHTMTDASRLLPDVLAFLIGPGLKIAGKALGKGGTKIAGKVAKKGAEKATKEVAQKLVNEGTSDAAMVLAKSKLSPSGVKKMAAKKWHRDLLSDKEAMERVVGRALKDNEIDAIKKNIDELIPSKVDSFNADVDELINAWKSLGKKERFETKDDILKYLNKNKDKLTPSQYKRLVENVDNLPAYSKMPGDSKLKVDDILEETKNVKEAFDLKGFGKDAKDVLKSLKPVGNLTLRKTIDSALNNVIGEDKPSVTAEIGPVYDYSGSEPTPVKDFFASLFDLDFNDPARFNEKDINAFMSFLGEKGFFEKTIDGNHYVSDFWSPRQKVSYIRHQLSDKDKAELFKKYWLESEQRKELLNGEE